MEQVLDWLNENELRAYPLLDGVSKNITLPGSVYMLPDSCILDLQLRLAIPLSVGTAIPSPVYLKNIVYTYNTSLSFVFGTSTTTIATFVLNTPTVEFPRYIRNSDGNLLVLGTGTAELLDKLNSVYGETSPLVTLSTQFYVEPTTCIPFDGAWLGVSTIKGFPEKETETGTYAPVLPLEDKITSTSLQGDVKLLEGYNFRINTSSGAIDLEIGKRHGLRMNCTTSFLPEECRDCHELVSYINGVPPDASGNFRLTAGTNISITSGETVDGTFNDNVAGETEPANPHTIFVGLSFQSSDLCAPVNITPSSL
jgi:hypothetical protein